jgi:hypothetical protein
MLVAREARNRNRTVHCEQAGFFRAFFVGLHPVVEKRRFVYQQLKVRMPSLRCPQRQ